MHLKGVHYLRRAFDPHDLKGPVKLICGVLQDLGEGDLGGGEGLAVVVQYKVDLIYVEIRNCDISLYLPSLDEHIMPTSKTTIIKGGS